MRNLLNPKWILLINTLPIILLFFIYSAQFNIIKSLLDDESIGLWQTFGWTLAGLSILNLVYALYLIITKQKVSLYYGFLALLIYIPYIYFYGINADKIIPFSIPDWMVSGEMFLYVGTFLMPTLAYAMFVLVHHFTSGPKDNSPLRNFLMALMVPISYYAFSLIVLPFWKPLNDDFGWHAFLILGIIGTLLFLFFLIRTIYILAVKKSEAWRNYQLFWKIPIALIFPLMGLALNNGHIYSSFGPSGGGIFGDFSSAWFYGLAIINGLLICLPNIENKLYRIFLFIGRCLTFAYTFYFFLVFLPFLPMSIVGIFAIGLGFLMLTPLVLFVLHINELSRDFSYLKQYFSNKLIWAMSIIGFLVMPLLITTSHLKAKTVLIDTLDYIYTPDYSAEYEIDKNSLQKTLNVVKGHKETNRGGIFGTQTPYLSTFFNWLVLDNLTLSDTKINKIENIFFGQESFELDNTRSLFRPSSTARDLVNISNISSSSRYDNEQNAWVSWIDFELTNESESFGASEYATTIDLPTGCWISDYYLYVGDMKEMGILAEKKSAMWIYSQIRNERKDPGILYYLTGNKVAFKVFPFAKKEVRKTGIEFLHKEPVNLTIDGHELTLGNERQEPLSNLESNNALYVSSKQKESLNKIERASYYHFLVDVSKNSDVPDIANRMEQLMSKNPSSASNAKVSFVNAYTNTYDLDSNWEEILNNMEKEGGFFLDRAIKQVLFESYATNKNTYPTIVVISDNMEEAVLDNNYADFKMAFPDNELFYNLTKKGSLFAHSLVTNSSQSISDSLAISSAKAVLVYEHPDNSVSYLRDNAEASILLKPNAVSDFDKDMKLKDWTSALSMQGMWDAQVFDPKSSKTGWLTLVKSSFTSRVMTPLTSFLVVENEAQKAVLMKKQAQMLAGNKSLDLGEDAQRMSEPNMVVVMLLFGFLFLFRSRYFSFKEV